MTIVREVADAMELVARNWPVPRVTACAMVLPSGFWPMTSTYPG
jgi:hypothetical protein